MASGAAVVVGEVGAVLAADDLAAAHLHGPPDIGLEAPMAPLPALNMAGRVVH